MAAPDDDRLAALANAVWHGSLPVTVVLAPGDCTAPASPPYHVRARSTTLTQVQVPRVSYLPILLPRLRAFFGDVLAGGGDTGGDDESGCFGWFDYDGVPLKWHYPAGLLYDCLARGELPWTITLHTSNHPDALVPLDPAGKVLHDAYVNTVKEADFVRNGTGKAMMGMSKRDSQDLWRAVGAHNYELYTRVAAQLFGPGAGVRAVPVRVYLPTPTAESAGQGGDSSGDAASPGTPPRGSLKVVQGAPPPSQTLGAALHALLPAVFPSRRAYIYAQAVVHGVGVPAAAGMGALQQLAYADGFVHVSVELL